MLGKDELNKDLDMLLETGFELRSVREEEIQGFLGAKQPDHKPIHHNELRYAGIKTIDSEAKQYEVTSRNTGREYTFIITPKIREWSRTENVTHLKIEYPKFHGTITEVNIPQNTQEAIIEQEVREYRKDGRTYKYLAKKEPKNLFELLELLQKLQCQTYDSAIKEYSSWLNFEVRRGYTETMLKNKHEFRGVVFDTYVTLAPNNNQTNVSIIIEMPRKTPIARSFKDIAQPA